MARQLCFAMPDRLQDCIPAENPEFQFAFNLLLIFFGQEIGGTKAMSRFHGQLLAIFLFPAGVVDRLCLD